MTSGSAPRPEAPGSHSAVPAVDTTGEPRERWRRIRRFALELALFAGLYLAIVAYQDRHLVKTGALAPRFDLPSLGGGTVSLDSLRGKRVLLHFWATWCGVCNLEFPALNAVHRELAPDETLVSIVADSDDAEALRRFVAEKGLQYPVLLASSETLRAYRVDTLPTNYFLDATGRVESRTVGMSNRMALKARLALAR